MKTLKPFIVTVEIQTSAKDYTEAVAKTRKKLEKIPNHHIKHVRNYRDPEPINLALFYQIERELSLMLQPQRSASLQLKPDAITQITRIRDELRNVMRQKGWKGNF